MKKLRTQRVLQEGFITFFEIIKAILMGIVEGITEWLPISSTGHMILVEQVVKFNASEEFMSMFRVVIQLGAILAVVVLFWNKLWPFGLRQGKVISKPSVWNLWFKVVAATLPVLVISPLDDWMEEHFYNYITVAAMLILYGVLFLVVENRRTTPRVTKLEQISYRDALLIGVWQCLAIIPGTSRSGATIVGGLLLGLLLLVCAVLVSRRMGFGAYCLGVCPLGLVAGRLGRLSPWRVWRTDACTRCKACVRVCRYGAMTEENLSRAMPGPTCTLCRDCLSACRQKALTFSLYGTKHYGPAVESAFMLVKPPMPKGLMQLSAPPQTITDS